MRIVSYNVHGGFGIDGRFSISRIASHLNQLRADIICLQEVHAFLPSSRLSNQPRRLARELQMRLFFQRCLGLCFWGFGNAIASRWPIQEIRSHRLPSQREPRGALECRIQTPVGPITVFNTHWGLQPAERLRQAKTLSNYLRQTPFPYLLCGDLNDHPESLAVHLLLEQTRLHDAVLLSAPFATFPALNPQVRIDYIFHTPNFRVLSTEQVIWLASDHLPVIVDLALIPEKNVTFRGVAP
ncbi:metal-dependent hydrolase [Chthonomonas calidirosea]|uniref:Metal-dependent hydrolase n=1 Tax=Chthonomonas calidirosea (strain DSM 23976 / ICMP 18418 / T49) TaxID=1303518 RepID=S0ESE1_CHTCT|nr:endonuclease/exonuclease/phosphatase family protein [Chthonomonas calidirosea]CCW34089.1 Metal-dependent hydrolase [Chthonomonas calidirosea T49]CEK15788.1 metal-dependent hydrolase [Chthonomonas calidirosea]